MKDFIKDLIYAFFDSSQAVALVAIGFITFFYTTKASDATGFKLKLRKIAKISALIYFPLLTIYLVYKGVDAGCEARKVKMEQLQAAINARLSRDSASIVGIRSKIKISNNTDSVYELNKRITNINYNKIRRLQNFKVYITESCTSCNDYARAKEKFDSLKLVIDHENY